MTKQADFLYNILCVDDNANNLFTLNALLQTIDNVKIFEALNAKNALNKLITTKIDLLLLDVQMPDINGFELAKMIKSNKRTREIPIIFITAVFKSDEFKKKGFEIGAVDYITKPIEDNQLLNKLSLYLKIFEQKNIAVQSKKHFYDIAQNIGDGIYTLDLNKKTTFINDEALKQLGYKYSELINKKISDFIYYKDINNKPILLKNCKTHKSIVAGEIYKDNLDYLIKKDGSFLPVSIVYTPLYENNNIFGTVVVFRDKTHDYKIKLLEEEKIKNQEQIINSMIDMTESRDSYTVGHARRVSKYCVMIAKEMNYCDDDIELLKHAAWLHDIGKISTSDIILLKPDKLSEAEHKIMQEHLTSGYNMLAKIDQYKEIAQIMREHHERFDGKGYPLGLKADEIKPLSKIIIVADAFDAMTTDRIYKPKKSIQVALKEVENLSTKQFHPEVVNAAVKVFKDIKIDIN